MTRQTKTVWMHLQKTTQTLYNINIVHTLVKTITHEQGN